MFPRYTNFLNGLQYPKWVPSYYTAIQPPLLGSFTYQTKFIQYQTQNTNPDNNNCQGNENIEKNTPPTIVRTKEEVKISEPISNELKLDIKDSRLDNDDSLAPYRAHPLFHYLKNKNTIQKDKIISFRNEHSVNKNVTTLILKPVARALAGVQGTAISNPLSKAKLRYGTNVDILFEPEAVAIAGPGGIAHAESDLEISYEDII